MMPDTIATSAVISWAPSASPSFRRQRHRAPAASVILLVLGGGRQHIIRPVILRHKGHLPLPGCPPFGRQ